MDKEIFVQNVKDACKAKGIKPTVACRESGVSTSFITNIEKGSEPSVAKVQMLAAYLGMTTSELLGEKKEPTPVSEVGFDVEHKELVSLYDAASPALRAAALAVLRSADGQVTEAEPDQAAAQPEMLETVELEGIGPIQIKKMEPLLFTGSAKKQGTDPVGVRPWKWEYGTVTVRRTKPQKSPQAIPPDAQQPIMRRKDRLKKLAELLEATQSTKWPGGGHGHE